jgi:hypothetical protein
MAEASAAWAEAQAYQAEHERLVRATEHAAVAVAELTRALAAVGDHSAAWPVRAALDEAQLAQARLATAAEKALSLARVAQRRAQQEDLQRQLREG